MAGVIKAGTRINIVPGASSIAYQFDDGAISPQEKARREGAEIVNRALAEADQIRAQAADEGRRAALQAVEAALRGKVEQQLTTLTPALKAAVQSILQARLAWQRHWEQHALRLATAVASRIVRREVQRVPVITVELVREALQLAIGNEKITLRLNPQDHATLGELVNGVIAELGTIAETRVLVDGNITPGGCRVDTEFGSIDQQLETQLARITEELLA